MRNGSLLRSMLRPQSFQKIALLVGLICASVSLAHPALAHHAMGGRMPATFVQGFLSGIAHPIIGPDHFAFIVAVGLLAAAKPLGIIIPIAFIPAAMLGTGAHLLQWSLPEVELLVSGSILLFGLMLALKNNPKTPVIAALAGLSGFFHGYAYGESIFGAESTPLMAYLIGLTVVQMVIAVSAFGIGKQLLTTESGKSFSRFRSAGLVIFGVGLAFFASQLIATVFPT